jgi:hypothetical protein
MSSNSRILPASMVNRWTFPSTEPRFQNLRVILPTHNCGDTVPAAFGGVRNHVAGGHGVLVRRERIMQAAKVAILPQPSG